MPFDELVFFWRGFGLGLERREWKREKRRKCSQSLMIRAQRLVTWLNWPIRTQRCSHIIELTYQNPGVWSHDWIDSSKPRGVVSWLKWPIRTQECGLVIELANQNAAYPSMLLSRRMSSLLTTWSNDGRLVWSWFQQSSITLYTESGQSCEWEREREWERGGEEGERGGKGEERGGGGGGRGTVISLGSCARVMTKKLCWSYHICSKRTFGLVSRYPASSLSNT